MVFLLLASRLILERRGVPSLGGAGDRTERCGGRTSRQELAAPCRRQGSGTPQLPLKHLQTQAQPAPKLSPHRFWSPARRLCGLVTFLSLLSEARLRKAPRSPGLVPAMAVPSKGSSIR